MTTEPTEHWASLDQFTSFAKEPWAFNRATNRKEHSVLSKATFVEWPNTTCDFSIHHGLAPPGKLAPPKPRFISRSVDDVASSSSLKPKPIATKASGGTTKPERAGTTTNGKPAAAVGTATTAAPSGSKARNSADNVTAAFTLWSSRKASGSEGQHEASSPTQQEAKTRQKERKDNRAVPSWSVNNIGFSNVQGEARARREREHRESYVRAAFASQAADKPYIAEATNFRFRYPHTLGRITALSHARSDRAAGVIHKRS